MATYVLLHGAYQGGWIWQRVTPHLRAAGHTVFAPTLDGCAERRQALRPGIDTESQADGSVEDAVLRGPARYRPGRHKLRRHGRRPRGGNHRATASAGSFWPTRWRCSTARRSPTM